MITDILQIGNKIDITSLNKEDIRREDDGKMPVMVSQVEAVEDSGELIILMPVYQGKIILLSIGSRYEMLFYTRKGLYRGVCQVIDRYKEDNMFVVKVVLKSGLNKFQRREYYRLECILGMRAYELDREDALRLKEEDLEEHLKNVEISTTEKDAVIVDISGGGIRFIGQKMYEEGDCLAVRTELQNEHMDLQLLVVVSIVTCRKATPNAERYETRAEFMHLGSKLRESIIKYVFDEDRKIRKREMGV